ncbi:MAG: HAD-IA family hydrolase [Bacteroidetes bacterium]|nr:HAD-IA family hydrolase [Bacteroidota bacterium]
MSTIKFIYFDAANTLIHKPELWKKINEVLTKYGHTVNAAELKKKHKFTSEKIKFPDNTSKDFYNIFNKELLSALGVNSNEEILNDIYNACTYLPWQKFDDVTFLKEIELPIGIISNFNSSLKEKINNIISVPFSEFIISEDVTVAKPDPGIFEFAINKIGLPPEEILFIGDSIFLDIEPAKKIGMKAYLIDRDNVYPTYQDRISSLEELKHLI